MLISPEYAEQNRKLHESRDDYGRSSRQWVALVAEMMRQEKHESILDYGCGKGELKRGLPLFPIREYDPAIPGKDAKPEPADLLVCTDVLEHVEPNLLNSVLRELARLTKRKAFLAISTVPSSKTLADGRNAHLIVQDRDWWVRRLERHFIVFQDYQHGPTLVVQALPKGTAGVQPARKDVPAGLRQRRPITREWLAFFDHIRQHSAKYSDAFSRIVSINMFEDLPDDPPSDMQAVVNLLDNVPNPEAVMRRVMTLSRKAVLVTVKLTKERDEDWWRNFLGKFIRIVDWQPHEGSLVCIGSPMVAVQGVTAVGVVDPEERWQQILTACKRIERRIEPVPAHGKRALIACYGPSLKATIEEFKREAEDPNTAVVSVSGSHDFLVQHGIVPDFHIECDPRAHKADNIERPVDGVQYLIASACHTAMFEKLAGGDIRLWHVSSPEHQIRLIDELGERAEWSVSGGGSVGLRSIPLMYAYGFREFVIHGMDCSFSDDGEQQWAGKHAGKRQDLCQVDCAGRIFTSSPVLMTYATGFFETIQKVPDCTFKVVGDGLLQSMCAVYQGMVPQLDNAA